MISIHRPLAGPDVLAPKLENARMISIHRPLAGPDAIQG